MSRSTACRSHCSGIKDYQKDFRLEREQTRKHRKSNFQDNDNENVTFVLSIGLASLDINMEGISPTKLKFVTTMT